MYNLYQIYSDYLDLDIIYYSECCRDVMMLQAVLYMITSILPVAETLVSLYLKATVKSFIYIHTHQKWTLIYLDCRKIPAVVCLTSFLSYILTYSQILPLL